MCGRQEHGNSVGAYFLKTNCMGLLTQPQASFYTVPLPNTNDLVFFSTSQYVYSDSIDGGHYLWHFGDGTTSIELNPTHQYTQDGVYTITLTAVVCNDTSLMQQTVCVGSPAFAPLFSTQTNDLSVSLINQSTGVVENQGSFIWSFGDGSLPVQTQDTLLQQHNYTQSGIYTIDLQAIVCNDTLLYRQTIEVIALASPQPPPKEGELQGLFSITPNPANGYLTISNRQQKQLKEANFVLYNMLGQVVVVAPLLKQTEQISLTNIPTGVYLYQIINHNKNQTLQYGKVSVLH